ncbi:sigma-54 dependent transcriptional regulator, partial [bacterium]|nr:sigma-54 dependent transcriptional regulator [bacterium]
IARQVHAKSQRNENRFVALNCSAIPENLLEAELFGHEKGAFTGADRSKPGWFEAADSGTIFLDEIGELSPAAQVRLLRLIQFGEFTPVGSKEAKKVDARIIAATNRNLAEMVEAGTFRKDLYFRLNVIELKLPLLRERGTDILQLAEYFLARFATKANKKVSSISDEAKQLLLKYEFPGNVRELENIVQRAILLCKGDVIQRHDLSLIFGKNSSESPAFVDEANFKAAKEQVVSEFEKDFLVARLRESNGNITRAANTAGMYKKNFIDKMKQHDVRAADYK